MLHLQLANAILLVLPDVAGDVGEQHSDAGVLAEPRGAGVGAAEAQCVGDSLGDQLQHYGRGQRLGVALVKVGQRAVHRAHVAGVDGEMQLLLDGGSFEAEWKLLTGRPFVFAVWSGVLAGKGGVLLLLSSALCEVRNVQ